MKNDGNLLSLEKETEKNVQQIVYEFAEEGMKELGRSSGENWQEVVEDVLVGEKQYITLSVPSSSEYLPDRETLFDLSSTAYDGLLATIIGRKKLLSEEDLQQILLHPDCPVRAEGTNAEQVIEWYDSKIDYFTSEQAKVGGDNREETGYYSYAIDVITQDRQLLLQNSFPEKQMLNEISAILKELAGRLTNVKEGHTLLQEEAVINAEHVESGVGDTQEESGKNELEQIYEEARRLLEDVDDLEKRKLLYEEQGLPAESSEIQVLFQDCDVVQVKLEDLSMRLDRYLAGPGQQEEKVQVIVVNNKGFYQELAVETDSLKFLAPHEVEKFAEGLGAEYPGLKVMAIEVDKKKYTSIQGLSPDVAQERDRLLKSDGTITAECMVPVEKEQEKIHNNSVNRKNDAITQKMDRVAEHENRNLFEIMEDYAKMFFLIFKDMFGISRKEEKEKMQQSQIEKGQEVLQIIAVEQPDGSVIELKSERNPNLFLQEHELKAYAEDVAHINGKFRLIEMPKEAYPDVNKYLDKGIMTDEGKQRYQEAKASFIKGCKDSVTYEVTGKAERGEEEKKKMKQKQPENKTKLQVQKSVREEHGKDKKKGRKR